MSDSSTVSPPRPIVGVGAVIWNKHHEVVLIRRGQAPRKGDWSIPGGRLEWGETLATGVLREVHEETGLTAEIVAPIETVDSITRDESGTVLRHYVLVDFVCLTVSGELRAGSDAADARWVPFGAIGEYGLWSETKRIIEKSAAILRSLATTPARK